MVYRNSITCAPALTFESLLSLQVLELEANEAAGYNLEECEDIPEIEEEPQAPWHLVFREQQQQIIELWDICHVSIIHRTQFYLLFKGDPADQIYMEVELRRLTWLQQHLTEMGNASPAPQAGNEAVVSLSSRSDLSTKNMFSFFTSLGYHFQMPNCHCNLWWFSIRALKREREFLARRMNTRMTAEEREALFIKWDVPLDGKQRRLQFVNKLWTDPHNEMHIQESAAIVEKLVGVGGGGNLTKEMVELNFALPSDRRQWHMDWNQILKPPSFVKNIL